MRRAPSLQIAAWLFSAQQWSLTRPESAEETPGGSRTRLGEAKGDKLAKR